MHLMSTPRFGRMITAMVTPFTPELELDLPRARLVLKEGRNRVVRRTFEALGLPVSRLMRVRFGIINLPPRIKRGMMAELGDSEVRTILEWVGLPAGVPRQVVDDGRRKKVQRARPRKN